MNSFQLPPRILLGSALLLFAATFPANGSLLIYYPLNETSGNVANDAAASDGAQNATATAAASNWQITGGILGGALQFSPTAQGDVDEALIYNTASTTTSLLSSTPFTLSLWINTTDATAANHAAVYLGDRTKTDQYYAVGSSAINQPQLVARNTTAINTAAPTAINDGAWHNLVAVFSATNSRTFYIDGKLVGTSTTAVTHPILNRFGIGALTRSNPTDAYAGLLDEVGLFDTAKTAQEAALLNAFPRYDSVSLDDTDFDLGLTVFNTQSGSVTTGTWTWSYGTGLSGTLGTTGLVGGNPYVVLDSSGNGLVAVPEPGSLTLSGILLGMPLLRRRRKVR